MAKIDPLQQQFFDDERHHYTAERILRPPIHTQREISIILNRLHDVQPGTIVVDFGAGTGRLTISLLQAGFPVLAIDFSAASPARLRATATALGLNAVQTASALPDWLGGLPGLRIFAYRFIIEAKGGSPAAAPSPRDMPALSSQREDRATTSDG